MLATTPHELLPSWINATTDWYSFYGNTASLIGFLLSAIALGITVSVKRQVRRIEREYVMRLNNRQWVAEVMAHAEKFLSLSETKPFSTAAARVELARTISLVRILSDQIPSPLRKDAATLIATLEEHRPARLWKRPRAVDADLTFDVYVALLQFGDSLQHLALKYQTAPTR